MQAARLCLMVLACLASKAVAQEGLCTIQKYVHMRKRLRANRLPKLPMELWQSKLHEHPSVQQSVFQRIMVTASMFCNVCSLLMCNVVRHRSLNNNQFTSIPSGAFAGLGGLTELYVDMCCLCVQVHLSQHRILHRYLYSNQITSIASGAFTGLSSLTRLYAAVQQP
jgi:hypothetical protein